MIPCKEKKNDITIDTININIRVQFFNFSICHTRKLELFSYGYNCARHYFEHKVLEDTIIMRDF